VTVIKPRLTHPAAVCAVLALAVGFAGMAPSLRAAGWNLTGLPHVGARTALGRAATAVDPGFHTVVRGAYDGQFYWAIAIDPLATGSLHTKLDKPTYRYGHPLYAWLAWILSAARARRVAAVLAFLGLTSLAAGAAAAALFGRRQGRSGWIDGLFVALNPGLVVAASSDLAEPLAAALLICALGTYIAGRRRIGLLLFALLPLAKEPLVLVPLGVSLWELRRGRRRAAAAAVLSTVPAVIWWTYSRVVLGGWFTSGGTALAAPFSGWLESLAGEAARHPSLPATVFLVLVLILLLLGAVRAFRHGHAVAYPYLGLLIVVACLAPNATIAFSTALRNVSLALVLLPLAAMRQGRARRRAITES
jgi:hypothetical protein